MLHVQEKPIRKTKLLEWKLQVHNRMLIAQRRICHNFICHHVSLGVISNAIVFIYK